MFIYYLCVWILYFNPRINRNKYFLFVLYYFIILNFFFYFFLFPSILGLFILFCWYNFNYSALFNIYSSSMCFLFLFLFFCSCCCIWTENINSLFKTKSFFSFPLHFSRADFTIYGNEIHFRKIYKNWNLFKSL